ncbi:hypothetical protein EGW08_005394 [Elysia chlorotica]|uniref:Uncharacterized protein n=1 Tax=Elysia chlorotica TaxID=188477 RepID=A0A3S1AAL1_ELYCH|nr:hypothetical protein EGW08_005394 [Elysia chlorotica]
MMAFANVYSLIIDSFHHAIGGLKSFQIAFYERAANLPSAIDEIVSDSFRTSHPLRRAAGGPTTEPRAALTHIPTDVNPPDPVPNSSVLHVKKEFSQTSSICMSLACVLLTFYMTVLCVRRRRCRTLQGRTEHTRPLIRQTFPSSGVRAAPPGASFAFPVYIRAPCDEQAASGDSPPPQQTTCVTTSRPNDKQLPHISDPKTDVMSVGKDNFNKKLNMKTASRLTTSVKKAAAGTKTFLHNLPRLIMCPPENRRNGDGLLLYSLDVSANQTMGTRQFTNTVEPKTVFADRQPGTISMDQRPNTHRHGHAGGKATWATTKAGRGITQGFRRTNYHRSSRKTISPSVLSVPPAALTATTKYPRGSVVAREDGRVGNEDSNASDRRSRSLSPTVHKGRLRWTSSPDKAQNQKPTHSVFIQAPTRYTAIEQKPVPESRENLGRWAGGLPKERICEIRQKTRELETNLLVKDRKTAVSISPRKQPDTPIKHPHVGQQRTPYQLFKPSTRNGPVSELKQLKYPLPVKKKTPLSGSHKHGKCNPLTRNDEKPRFKSDWPIFSSSIVAKHPKRRKTQDKMSKNKPIRTVVRKGIRAQFERAETIEDPKRQRVTPILPIRPLASPVKFSDSHSLGIFELRKTATPNLCSLSGKGAFTSYTRRDQFRNPRVPVAGQETASMESNPGMSLADPSSVVNVPPATSVDTLHEAAILLLDQQHNRARHNTRFLSTSATELQSSSNDCSLMAEQPMPTQMPMYGPHGYIKSSFDVSNLKAELNVPLKGREYLKPAKKNNANGAKTEQVQFSQEAGAKNFLPPLLKRNKARTISLSQESKSKTYDKSFSINLQFQTPMGIASRAQPESNKSKVELRKASPLQFEMPMQEPLYSDIIQTLNPRSKTVGSLCTKKAGMGAYLDEASKRSSIIKPSTENSIRKISSNSSKYFLAPNITRQPSGKLKGNTVFRITRNRVTTLKTQQGQKAPHAPEIGLMTRKQLFQQRSKTVGEKEQTVAGSHNENTVLSHRTSDEKTPIFPPCNSFTAKFSGNQKISERAETFRVRRVDGTDSKDHSRQLLSDNNSLLINHKGSVGLDTGFLGNDKDKSVRSKSLFATSEQQKMFFTERSTHDTIPCSDSHKTNGQRIKKELDSELDTVLPLFSRLSNEHMPDSKQNLIHKVQNYKTKSEDPAKPEWKIIDNHKALDSHPKNDSVCPHYENIFCQSQPSFCSCSNSHCSFNVNHLSGSSSFNSNYATGSKCNNIGIRKSGIRQVKSPTKVLSVYDTMSRLHAHCWPPTKLHSPTHFRAYHAGKLRTSRSKTCSTTSSSLSLHRIKYSNGDRRHFRNKRIVKRIPSKENSTEFFLKNATKSPLLSRYENLRNNQVRYCKMKKTKLLRHEPYRKGRAFQKKEPSTPRSHRSYRARNRNNCSPLHKRRKNPNALVDCENFENCTQLDSGFLSIPSSIQDRQLQGIHSSFFNRKEKKLDVNSEMCSQSVCQNGEHYTFTSTTNRPKNHASLKNERSDSSVTKWDSEIPKLTRQQLQTNNSFAPRRLKINSLEAMQGYDNAANTIQVDFKNPFKQVSTATEAHLDGMGTSPTDPNSNSIPATKSHMTQTDTSISQSLDVAIQTSPTTMYTRSGSQSRRPTCRSNHLVQEYVKHRAREMRFERFLRRRQVSRLVPRKTEDKDFSICNTKNRNKLVFRTRVSKNKPSPLGVMSRCSKDQAGVFEFQPLKKCPQEQMPPLEEENQNLSQKKIHLPQKKETISIKTSECVDSIAPNAVSANDETKLFTMTLSENENTPQFEPPQNVSQAKREIKCISHPSHGQGIFTRPTQKKHPHLNEAKENSSNSEQGLSPRTFELHNMCLVRPSWKNVNIEEVDRRVKWALRLRRELQLSRSSSGQMENSSLSSDLNHNIKGNYSSSENRTNQNNGACKKPRKVEEYHTDVCNDSKTDVRAGDINNEPFYSSTSMYCDSDVKQNGRFCSSQNLAKNDGDSSNAKESSSCGYNKESKITFNHVTKTDKPEHFFVRESAALESSTRTEQSLSLQDLTASASKVLPNDRPASAGFQAQTDHASWKKKAQPEGHSPPGKTFLATPCCPPSVRPRLVGSLVQRLPQVPLSSFVEWFIETSDPKNFLTSDKSSASSDEKGSECKSISGNNTASATVQQVRTTYPSQQAGRRLMFHSDEAQYKSSTISSIQIRPTMADTSTSKRQNNDDHGFSKTTSFLSTDSFQYSLNHVKGLKENYKTAHHFNSKVVNSNESNQTTSNERKGRTDLNDLKWCISSKTESCSSNATPPLCFEKSLAYKTKTLRSATSDYVIAKKIVSPQTVDAEGQSASQINSQTYTCDDRAAAVETLVETDKRCGSETLCSSSGQDDYEETDTDHAQDRRQRQACHSKNSINPLHTSGIDETLSSSPVTDIYQVPKAKLNQNDSNEPLYLERETPQASSNTQRSRITEKREVDEKSDCLHLNLEGVAQSGTGHKDDTVERKCDPGIRHILMKLRQPECDDCPTVSEQKSGKVRITLRRSSDVFPNRLKTAFCAHATPH